MIERERQRGKKNERQREHISKSVNPYKLFLLIKVKRKWQTDRQTGKKNERERQTDRENREMREHISKSVNLYNIFTNSFS